MSTDLSDRNAISQLDISNVLGSIEQLPQQIEDAWNNTSKLDNHQAGQGINHIIVAGMGGSNLGAVVIQALAKQSLKVPLEIVKDYTLPGYVNQNTLVILSSYSGTTEETLAAAKAAKEKGAQIAVITAGGDLAKLATENHYPIYLINPQYNPSNQPRMAIGYAITGQIGLLNSFGLIDSSSIDLTKTIEFLKKKASQFAPETTDNLAKNLANSAVNKLIYLISAEHLTGATHVFNNQLNENAKHLTVELAIPEMNHHYLEALSHPETAPDSCIFWLINSTLYSQKNQTRINVTKDVIEKNHYQTNLINLEAEDIVTQAFEVIQLGAYTNFYLAMLHGIDPAPIPWVDYFKQQLKSVS